MSKPRLHPRLHEDSAYCEPQDAGHVLVALSRINEVASFSWRSPDTVHWLLDVPTGDAEAANLMVRRIVEKARCSHRSESSP